MSKTSQLHSVYLNLTTGCNLRCRHCFIEAGLPQPNELSTEEIVRVLDEVALLGVDKVTFTGGEPMLRYDILELARHAASLLGNGISQLALVTNAMLINKDAATSIGYLFSSVNVSIDGLEAAHEEIRGKGSFDETIRGLRYLVQAGVDPTVFITVTRRNISSLGSLFNYLYQEVGIHRFKIRPLWKFGRAAKLEDMSAEKEDLIKLGFQSESVTDSVVADAIKEDGPLGYSINIHSDGRVYPCHLLRYPEFVAGSIRERPLAEIYHNSVIFKTLRDWGIRCCQQVINPREELMQLITGQKRSS